MTLTKKTSVKSKPAQPRKRVSKMRGRYTEVILNQMPDSFWMTNGSDGRIIEVNPATCHLLGYTREELLKMSVADVEASDSPKDIRGRIRQVVRNGSARFESRFRRKDGTVIDVEVSVTYLPENDLFFGFHHDITARKRMEEALRNSEEQYRTLFNESPVGIGMADPTGRVLTMNTMMEKITGYTLAELKEIGLFTTYVNLDDRNKLVEALRTFGQVKDWEVQLKRKDGTSYSALINVNQIIVDGQPVFLTNTRDITERKRAAEALQKNQARLQEAQRIAGLGDWEWDIQADRVTWSKELYALALLDENLPAPTYAEHPRFYTEESMKRLNEVVQRAIETGQPYELDLEMVRTDGSLKWLSARGEAVYSDEHKILGLRGTVFDITERKRAEQALLETEQRLRLTFDTMSEGIALNEIVYDEHGEMVNYRILNVNPAFYSIADYHGKEVIGSLATELYNMTPEFIKEFWKQHKQKNTTAYAEMLSPLTQRRFFVSTSPFVNDRFVTSFVDITGRKQAEDALRESEAALKQAQRVAHVGSWAWHIQDNSLQWSDEMYRIFGYEKENFSGRLDEVMAQAIHPEDRAEVERSNLSVIREKKPIPLEYRVIRPDHTIRAVWAEAGELTLDEQGNPILLTGIVQDITERKQAEEALKESRRRYQLIFENSGTVNSIFDTECRLIMQNSLSIQHLGMKPEEAMGKTALEIFGPERGPQITERMQHVLAAGVSESFETEFNLPTGKKWFRSIYQPIFDEQRVLFGIQVISQDITESKRAEEELRLREESYTGLFNAVVEAIYIQDANGVFLNVNEGALKMYGYSREELLGKTPEFVSAPGKNDLAAIFTLVQRVFATGQAEAFEFWGRRKNGEIFPKDCISNKGRYFGMDVIITTARDVTDRKRAEEALNKSETLFRAVVENNHEGILLINAERQPLYVSPSYERLSGYSAQERMAINGPEYMHPDDLESVTQAFKKVLRSPGAVAVAEYRLPHKSGHWFWVETTATNLLHDPHIQAIVLNSRDITERKQAEEKLNQLNEELEQRVEERTRELREMQAQLIQQQKLTVLGQVAGSVGHELRNPLGVISNAVYFLQVAQPDANAKIKDYLRLIEQQTRAAEMIITDLLDFTRLETMRRESIALPRLIYQTLERFPAPETVQVEFNWPTDLPQAHADPRHIVQILSNLTLNAYQAMAAKGGKIIFSSKAQDGQIQIAVQDTGMGISSENMAKLFEPLFTTKTKGIGLGLAVSKKLIEANGGRIEVESEEGKGSTFTVYLPLAIDLGNTLREQ